MPFNPSLLPSARKDRTTEVMTKPRRNSITTAAPVRPLRSMRQTSALNARKRMSPRRSDTVPGVRPRRVTK